MKQRCRMWFTTYREAKAWAMTYHQSTDIQYEIRFVADAHDPLGRQYAVQWIENIPLNDKDRRTMQIDGSILHAPPESPTLVIVKPPSDRERPVRDVEI